MVAGLGHGTLPVVSLVDGGDEPVDAGFDVAVGLLERLVGVQPDGIGHRPVQAARLTAQLLVGVVTDGHHEVAGLQDITEVSRARRVQGQAVPPSRDNGPAVDARAWLGTCGRGRHPAAPGPQGGGELRSCRVVRTYE